MKGYFRNKYKETVDEYKVTWAKEAREASESKFYKEITSSEVIADAMLGIYTRGAADHVKIKDTLIEYNENKLGYYSFQIALDEKRCEVEVNDSLRGLLWKTVQGFYVKPFDRTTASNLNAVELNEYPCGTLVNRDAEKGHVYYDPYSHTMWKKCKSRFDRFGFVSMHLDSKSPVPTGKACYRSCDQFTSLGKVMTTRKSESKTLLEQDCFLKTIGEITYSNYEQKLGKKITPIRLFDENKGIREEITIDYNTGAQVTKKSYLLTDLILVLDIDCGKQINYIMESFIDMPFSPHCITTEIGYGSTKKGNSTALVVFDSPMTEEQRHLLLKAYRYSFMCKYDVYAIDCHCTGIGYGKNPMATYKNELQREFRLLVEDGWANKTASLQDALTWAENIVSMYESFIDTVDDKFISSCEDLKNSKLSYSEIVKVLADTKKEIKEECSNTRFLDFVPVGMRNDALTQVEGPIFALQYYLLHGIESVWKSSTPLDIALAVAADIKSRYDNTDNQVSMSWIKQKFEWIVQRDRIALKNPRTRLEFLSRLFFQRNICIHNQDCRVMKLLGYSDFKESRFKNIREFNELGLKTRFSPVQQRHGADTQLFKSILYACSKANNHMITALTEMRRHQCDYYDDAAKNNIQNVIKLLPDSMDCTKKTLVANILLSKLASEVAIEMYEHENGFQLAQESTHKLSHRPTAFWELSLLVNGRFVDMKASNKFELNYSLANYMNTLCNEFIKFGCENPDCSFNDIKPSDVKYICKLLYSKHGINISIVHHMAVTLKFGVKTPMKIFEELCAMHTKEIANNVISLCAGYIGMSEQQCFEYFRHNYRASELSSNAPVAIFDIFDKVTNANNCIKLSKEWITNNILYYVEEVLQELKKQAVSTYTELCNTIRKILNDYITQKLNQGGLVSYVKTVYNSRSHKSLIKTKGTIIYNDILDSIHDIKESLLSCFKFNHLKLVNAIV